MRNNLDELDIRLIEALLADARRTNRDLSQVLGLSESACLARTRALEAKGLIQGYRAVIAFEKIGVFQVWADITLVDERPSTIAAFEEIAVSESEIVAAHVIGEHAQFKLHVVTADFECWQALSERLLGCGDLVRSIRRTLIFRRSRTSDLFPRSVLPLLLRTIEPVLE